VIPRIWYKLNEATGGGFQASAHERILESHELRVQMVLENGEEGPKMAGEPEDVSRYWSRQKTPSVVVGFLWWGKLDTLWG
jgi:hypothetical protein